MTAADSLAPDKGGFELPASFENEIPILTFS